MIVAAISQHVRGCASSNNPLGKNLHSINFILKILYKNNKH